MNLTISGDRSVVELIVEYISLSSFTFSIILWLLFAWEAIVQYQYVLAAIGQCPLGNMCHSLCILKGQNSKPWVHIIRAVMDSLHSVTVFFFMHCSFWLQEMTPKEKRRFEEMAEKDKARYDREMASYVPPKGAKAPKRKRTKDPNAPKRAL